MEPFFHLLRARSYRYLCRRCCTTVVIDPLTAVRLFCPICRESLIQQFDTPSTSPSSSPPLNLPAPPLLPNIPSRRTYMSRYATFERRDLSNDNLHVILLPGFFSCPYPNSPPFVTPLPQNHSVITLQILQNYIDYCANKGAIIHCTVPYPQAYPVMDDLIRFYGPRFGPQAASMPPDLTVTEDFLASVDSECSVCMESFKVGDVAIQLRCKHTHHKECIAPWFQIQNSCPLFGFYRGKI
ncbi:E3 ubiquitin-protein ligase RING1-like [Phalaenopsis equestris]|uniref:E3 ubiquitin-protein ligase RING1-like n=1 Tax=Phalaenopsis equestris TaxID=78828 RepID=UPI0009E2BDA2|nr:E3 ubiquitin-protein ligase RING1-like [Phalaenopsis equestris]